MADNAWIQTARLISRTGQGAARPEQELMEQLFSELRVPLLHYLQGLGTPPGDAEDVVQEAFLLLFRHVCAGKPRDNLRAWVYRVARNLALKRNQQGQWQQPFHPEWPEAADQAPNPEEQAALHQRERITRQVIDALPPLDRQCLELRAAGLKYREIAEVLEVALGSVAASVGRALSKIARATQAEK